MAKRNRPAAGIRRLLVALVSVAACVSLTSGASGADTVCASPPPSTIVAQRGVVTIGTAGDDVIYGTPGDDRIAGLGGNDIILGFGGADQLSGGDGNDTLCGGEGDDHLAGGAGHDLLSGEAGRDDLSGGHGDDRLLGDAGIDRLSGGDGSDSCGAGGDAGQPAPPADCETIITTTTTTTTTTTSAPTTTTTVLSQVATPNVFLGYVDTVGTPTFDPFPEPWAGDPGVTFLGCDSSSCSSWDAGAIRVTSPVSNPTLTLTDAFVDIGPCHFHPWDALLPATVGPGGTLILTQSSILGPPQPSPCDNSLPPEFRPIWNFNTSAGPIDTRDPAFFNCDTSLVPAPVITLVFDTMTLTIVDSAEVLSTGGVNRSACEAVNKSTPWTPVAPANIVRT